MYVRAGALIAAIQTTAGQRVNTIENIFKRWLEEMKPDGLETCSSFTINLREREKKEKKTCSLWEKE